MASMLTRLLSWPALAFTFATWCARLVLAGGGGATSLSRDNKASPPPPPTTTTIPPPAAYSPHFHNPTPTTQQHNTHKTND